MSASLSYINLLFIFHAPICSHLSSPFQTHVSVYLLYIYIYCQWLRTCIRLKTPDVLFYIIIDWLNDAGWTQFSTNVQPYHNGQFIKGLSHIADLARRSYTGAHIWRFSGIGASTAAQRYHMAKNGNTSSGHRQNIGEHISNDRRRYSMLNNICRWAAGASNGTTTAVLRYCFVNVGRKPIVPRYISATVQWLQCVPYWYRCETVVLPMY